VGAECDVEDALVADPIILRPRLADGIEILDNFDQYTQRPMRVDPMSHGRESAGMSLAKGRSN
jgi:hypothetical protein